MKPMESATGLNTEQRFLRLACFVLGVLLAVAACGGGPPPGGSPAAKPKAPPESFPQERTAVLQGAWPSPASEDDLDDVMTLGVSRAYAYDQDDVGITAFELDSGDTAWHTAIPHGGSVAQAPRLAGNKVIGAFATTEEGTGTHTDRHGISVVALNADTGETLWTRRLAGDDMTATAEPHVVAADAQHVLVTSYEQGYSESLPLSALLDTQTGQVIWTDTNFKGVDLEQSVAVGVRGDSDFVGKSASDGRQMWQRNLRLGEATASDAGPGLTLADGTTGETLLIDAATGATRLDSGDMPLSDCHYDGWNTAICAGTDGSGHAVVGALDVRTPHVLWRLPDVAARRDAPAITSAWHGVVYAQADQTMTLDARTGSDLRTSIGPIAPVLVNDSYGLVFDTSTRAVDVYRAT